MFKIGQEFTRKDNDDTAIIVEIIDQSKVKVHVVGKTGFDYGILKWNQMDFDGYGFQLRSKLENKYIVR